MGTATFWIAVPDSKLAQRAAESALPELAFVT
jgi:hypothetical protein